MFENGLKSFEPSVDLGVAVSRKFNPYVSIDDSRGADNG